MLLSVDTTHNSDHAPADDRLPDKIGELAGEWQKYQQVAAVLAE